MRNHVFLPILTLLLAEALLFGASPAIGDDIDANPHYKDPVKITVLKYDSIEPYMKITGLVGNGDSSAASDRLAITSDGAVTVYSLKTREKIFSTQYTEQDTGNERSSWDPSFSCRLSPDGKRLALILQKAQKVHIIDLATHEVQSLAISEPRLIKWSDMGEYLLVVGGTQKLQVVPVQGGKKTRVYDLIPPGGVPPEYKGDYKVDSIHLMPDNRILYFKSEFTITTGVYSMDLETGKTRQLDYGESISVTFSSTSEYLCQGSYEHPGDGYLCMGKVTSGTCEKLSAEYFVNAYSMSGSTAFAALDPWCAFYMNCVRTPGIEGSSTSIELLLMTENRLFRLGLGESDMVFRLFFSWFRHMLVVDIKTSAGREISVIDPRSLSVGK